MSFRGIVWVGIITFTVLAWAWAFTKWQEYSELNELKEQAVIPEGYSEFTYQWLDNAGVQEQITYGDTPLSQLNTQEEINKMLQGWLYWERGNAPRYRWGDNSRQLRFVVMKDELPKAAFAEEGEAIAYLEWRKKQEANDDQG